MNKIKILVVEHNEEPYELEIDNNLKAMQKVVGGYIECLEISDGIDLVCNEEGKINGMEYNRALYNIKIDDTIYGTFFVVGFNSKGEHIGLTNEQIKKWKYNFRL